MLRVSWRRSRLTFLPQLQPLAVCRSLAAAQRGWALPVPWAAFASSAATTAEAYFGVPTTSPWDVQEVTPAMTAAADWPKQMTRPSLSRLTAAQPAQLATTPRRAFPASRNLSQGQLAGVDGVSAGPSSSDDSARPSKVSSSSSPQRQPSMVSLCKNLLGIAKEERVPSNLQLRPLPRPSKGGREMAGGVGAAAGAASAAVGTGPLQRAPMLGSRRLNGMRGRVLKALREGTADSSLTCYDASQAFFALCKSGSNLQEIREALCLLDASVQRWTKRTPEQMGGYYDELSTLLFVCYNANAGLRTVELVCPGLLQSLERAFFKAAQLSGCSESGSGSGSVNASAGAASSSSSSSSLPADESERQQAAARFLDALLRFKDLCDFHCCSSELFEVKAESFPPVLLKALASTDFSLLHSSALHLAVQALSPIVAAEDRERLAVAGAGARGDGAGAAGVRVEMGILSAILKEARQRLHSSPFTGQRMGAGKRSMRPSFAVPVPSASTDGTDSDDDTAHFLAAASSGEEEEPDLPLPASHSSSTAGTTEASAPATAAASPPSRKKSLQEARGEAAATALCFADVLNILQASMRSPEAGSHSYFPEVTAMMQAIQPQVEQFVTALECEGLAGSEELAALLLNRPAGKWKPDRKWPSYVKRIAGYILKCNWHWTVAQAEAEAAAVAALTGEAGISIARGAGVAIAATRSSAPSPWPEDTMRRLYSILLQEHKRQQSGRATDVTDFQHEVYHTFRAACELNSLPLPVAEYPSYTGSVLDIAWPDARVAIEVDGPYHNSLPSLQEVVGLVGAHVARAEDSFALLSTGRREAGAGKGRQQSQFAPAEQSSAAAASSSSPASPSLSSSFAGVKASSSMFRRTDGVLCPNLVTNVPELQSTRASCEGLGVPYVHSMRGRALEEATSWLRGREVRLPYRTRDEALRTDGWRLYSIDFRLWSSLQDRAQSSPVRTQSQGEKVRRQQREYCNSLLLEIKDWLKEAQARSRERKRAAAAAAAAATSAAASTGM